MKKTKLKKKKKTTSKAKRSVYLEIIGKQLNVDDLYKKAEESYLEKHPDEKIKDIKLYINTLENKVYYVVNGLTEEDYSFCL